MNETGEGKEEKKLSTTSKLSQPSEKQYLRLFEKPVHRSIVDRWFQSDLSKASESKSSTAPKISGRERESKMSDDLINIIHDLALPEEIGTPREYCYKKLAAERQFEKIHPCIGNIMDIRVAVNLYKKKGPILKVEDEEVKVPFDYVQCVIYCLLTNLPIAFHNWSSGSVDEFKFEMYIYNFDNSSSMLAVRIIYDPELKKHIISASLCYWGGSMKKKVACRDSNKNLSILDVIDLVMYYGSRADIQYVSSNGEKEGKYQYYDGDIVKKKYGEIKDNLKYLGLTKDYYWDYVTRIFYSDPNSHIFATHGKDATSTPVYTNPSFRPVYPVKKK
jgi:hypothetical protein